MSIYSLDLFGCTDGVLFLTVLEHLKSRGRSVLVASCVVGWFEKPWNTIRPSDDRHVR
jgi:hypothetical protein